MTRSTSRFKPWRRKALPPPAARRKSHFDDTVIALSFSGGGMRAAAFSHGVLSGLADTSIRSRGGSVSLIDRIDIISGVSGGSVTAAYYGLKKRAALADFREKFLLRNAEEALSTDTSITNLARGFAGGINDSTKFPRWLDANLFHGATFADMSATQRPRVSINASDIYNRTPFLFGRGAFGALCSDFSTYPVSLAVAASAAVPVFFSPVVIQNFYDQCPLPLPEWVERVRRDPECAADAAAVRRRDRALPQGRREIRQAARRRPGRQLRAGRPSPSRACCRTRRTGRCRRARASSCAA